MKFEIRESPTDKGSFTIFKGDQVIPLADFTISASNIAMRMHRSANPFQEERKENLENAIAELNKWAKAFEVDPEIVVVETWKPE